MDEQEKNLQDYLAMLSRRKIPMLITIAVVFMIGIVVAMVWPPTYKSSATILIKEQEVPVELVRSTVTSYAAQRIQIISQRVMTRSNLLKIIEKYGLYKKELERKTTEEVLDDMRDDIGVKMISADVVDPRTGRPTSATIAFTLSFESENPASTQKVAGELTSLFLAENLKTRKEKANETYVFLTEEANKLTRHIAELEAKLAEFKEQHAASLPEMSNLNQSMMERVERELDMVESELRGLHERKFYTESQLAQTNPLTMMRSATGQSILDPASRLKALESEYASISAKYSEQHPDVIKIKREIEGLKQQSGTVSDSVEKAKQLSKTRSELQSLQKKYSPDHPDVIRLKKVVAKLESELKAEKELPERRFVENEPDNPAYISLQTQLKNIETDIESAENRKARLKKKVVEYEERISKAPQVEREYQVLMRDHRNATSRYQDIRSRQMEAEIGQELEKENKGESFQLIDPAQYPEKPSKPNRIAILFLSLVFSIACGAGLVVVSEMIDTTVRGVSGVTYMLTAAPLAVIPAIFTPRDYFRRKRLNRILVVSIVAGFVVVLLGIHFFYSPLDVIWFRGMRKAENIIGI